MFLYKLWSGFAKNIRYLLTSKGASVVKLPRFGTISRQTDDQGHFGFSFQPSRELSQ